MTNELVLKEFGNPGSEYRGAPFWAWNGRMDPAELRRQIRLMQRMGLGGFFMHSRVGLVTPYLSKEWMDCVAACVDEAEKLDMQAWLYDEDRWPSGAAGGLVTKNPAYRERQLEMLVFDRAAFRWRKEYLAAFVAKLAPPRASRVRRLKRGRKPGALAPGEKVLAFRVKLKPPSSWYNGYTYLDTMNPAAVREFLRVTHEAYRRRFGRQFGRRIPGIFTDEPTYGKRPGPNFLQWTDSLPRQFRRRYGYDLLDHLVELLFDVDGRTVSQARWHYFDCITQLFVDAFSRQIGEWCGRHHLAFIGHVLGEGSLAGQTNVVGSCLRFYEHMHAPGMDILTEYTREYDTAKQVSSAAHQFGRRWRLTETYGCTGWDFPFAGHKAVGDWQAALGINLRCQHLYWYTMEGEAKRDYPAAISHQSPWWQAYGKVEDYFARVHVLMSRGQEVRDLLVIHPVESMWTLQSVGNDAAKARFNDTSWKLRDALLAANIDFDWGDEDILARRARVRRRGRKAVLTVGKAAYTTVLVPPLLTIRSTTLALLRRFRAAGGAVVFTRPVPEYVDALPSSKAVDLAAGGPRAAGYAAAATAVEATARRVSITDARGRQIVPTLYCLREDDDAFYLFVCNTSHDLFGRKVGDLAVRDRRLAFGKVHVTVSGRSGAAPLELDAEAGEVFTADGRATRDGWTMTTSLPPLGSRLFLLPKNRLAKAPPRRRPLRTVRTTSLGGGRWDVRLSEPNCLVLDKPAFRVNGGRWQRPAEILKVDAAVRDAMGAPRRTKSMVQPWAQKKITHPRRATVELSYAFDVEALPTGALHLAVERPETFTVAVNGQAVNTDVECGWWVDRSLRKLPIDPAALKLGPNVLTLVCDYSELHSGLEIVYLIGEFGVRVRGPRATLTAAPRRLALGDWATQGLAFYGGCVGYTTTVRPRLAAGRRLFVQVPAYEGVAVRVLVDGQPAGIIGWEPNELDITDCVRGKRSAVLTVEVLGHRRNSHGPLHLNYRPRWFGPAEFHPRPDQEIAGYDLVPCGLMRAPRLVVRK